MKPSARSVATGPGSRGGTYYLDRAAYHRAWRAAHPEYRKREKDRKQRARELAAGAMPVLSDVITEIVSEETKASSLNRVALALAIDAKVVWRWVHGEAVPGPDGSNAVVATYGFDRLVRTMRRLRRVARRNQHDRTRAVPADTGSPPRPIDWQAVYDGDEEAP